MYQLKIGQLPLPTIMVTTSYADKAKARNMGIPFIAKPASWSDEKLVKAVLYSTLVKKFPHIRWRDVLGVRTSPKVNVPAIHEVESTYRVNGGHDNQTSEKMEVTVDHEYRFTGGGDEEEFEFEEQSIDDCIGDTLWNVSIEELQALKCLPMFMDDIASAIKTNLYNQAWMDGYNKKLGIPTGSYLGGQDAPNLIILDTSGSIPSGVAGTMVSLIDTIRSQCNANLIITSHSSWWYEAGDELPSPDSLRGAIGGCNECVRFYKILREHVLGKHWGNVIVFGDYDAPEAMRFESDKNHWLKPGELASTKVDNLMCFHTHKQEVPGYGLWVKDACPNVPITINHTWTKEMWR